MRQHTRQEQKESAHKNQIRLINKREQCRQKPEHALHRTHTHITSKRSTTTGPLYYGMNECPKYKTHIDNKAIASHDRSIEITIHAHELNTVRPTTSLCFFGLFFIVRIKWLQAILIDKSEFAVAHFHLHILLLFDFSCSKTRKNPTKQPKMKEGKRKRSNQ